MSAVLKLAILPAIVAGPYGSADAPALFEAVAKAADFRVGLELVPYNELFVEGDVATSVRDCGSDVPCISRALASARIDLGLRVIANFALDPPLITFNLVRDSVIAEEIAELDDRSLAAILEVTTEKLLAEYPRGGRLAIQASPPDATIAIDPPVSGVVPPGNYRVTATRAGHAPKTIEITVVAGAEETVRLSLDLIAEESSIASSPWLWTGVGAGVVAIVAIVLIVAIPNRSPAEGVLCVTTPMGGCP